MAITGNERVQIGQNSLRLSLPAFDRTVVRPLAGATVHVTQPLKELTIPPIPTIPAAGQQSVFNGRPPADFTGTLPYASEIFGVYQPLAGWLGRRNTGRIGRGLADGISDLPPDQFTGVAARTLDENTLLSRLAARIQPRSRGVLSPVGLVLVTLYREYFFQFDTFLGVPVGHIWISPGGTVELIETSTRRTLVEKTAAQSEDTTRKAEESLNATRRRSRRGQGR